MSIGHNVLKLTTSKVAAQVIGLFVTAPIIARLYAPEHFGGQQIFMSITDLGYKEGGLPESEKAAKETLALPIYPELTDE